MSAHTPGPWAIDPDEREGMEWNNHIVQANDHDKRICFMAHSGKPDNSEFEANARLIAEAPAMLDGLRLAIAALGNMDATRHLQTIVDRATGALGNATGEG